MRECTMNTNISQTFNISAGTQLKRQDIFRDFSEKERLKYYSEGRKQYADGIFVMIKKI